MNRSEDDIHVKEKVNEIVRNRLTGFASRYFSYNMDLKVPNKSLHYYSLGISIFYTFYRKLRPDKT